MAAWLLTRPSAPAQVKEWPACKKWTRKYLREAYGKQPAVVANYDMAFGDYLAYCRGSCDDMPLYLFDSGFAEKAPRLAGDYTVRSGGRAAPGCWATRLQFCRHVVEAVWQRRCSAPYPFCLALCRIWCSFH